ncbi:MAG: cell division protein ZapA [Acidobacteria bacterium]|nr:cell division protein ZapA [Acidobacteriota bacterium]
MSKAGEKSRAGVTQVEIFGQTYSVRAAGDPAYIEELAQFVDKRMREVADHAPTVDTTKIAILTALNISDEFHQFRSKAQEGDPGRFAQRASRLVERLDEILKTVPRGSSPGPEMVGTLRGA